MEALAATGSALAGPQAQLLRALLREDLSSFIQKSFFTLSPGQHYLHNWHIDAIAWHLQLCERGEIRRLLITMPPRSLKSICATAAFPAWVLGRDPTRRIVCASYANELTAKHARDFRAIVNADWYRALFPRTRPRKDTELELVTTKEGYRYGTSVGGTLYSRLDNKAEDVIVLIMRRLHLDDLAGHVLEQENWIHLNLPAVALEEEAVPAGRGQIHRRRPGELLYPAREPLSVLQEAKAVLGSYFCEALYQQAPVPESGNLIKWAWFGVYRELPSRLRHGRIVQSWDTASKAGELNDYSVCTTWLAGREAFYLIDMLRERLDYPSLRRRVVEMKDRHNAQTVLIEDKGSGTSLIQDLSRNGELSPIKVEPEGDKVTRMATQSAKIEAGQILLPQDAPWLADFKAEFLAFPHGRHDDQVDSLSQCLCWLDKRRAPMPAWGKVEFA